jgi:hypothetical protein
MKSALDLAVKFLEVLFPHRFKTKTFGDMGEDLIKGLEKFKKDKNAKKEIVDSIISMIRDDQTTWLKQAITLRSSLNPFGVYSPPLAASSSFRRQPESRRPDWIPHQVRNDRI